MNFWLPTDVELSRLLQRGDNLTKMTGYELNKRLSGNESIKIPNYGWQLGRWFNRCQTIGTLSRIVLGLSWKGKWDGHFPIYGNPSFTCTATLTLPLLYLDPYHPRLCISACIMKGCTPSLAEFNIAK